MPQMAPMGWLSLFIVFSAAFILFSVMNYYSTIIQSPKSKISSSKSYTSLNWKW